jgi:hypothetical protein
MRHKHRAGIKKWHKVLGEPRSKVQAIPGGRGLFSLLQTGFKFKDNNRIRTTPAIRAQLQDFEHLAWDLGSQPTKLSEIVPNPAAALGACNAAGAGIGGAWLAATTQSTLPPLLWRAPFPPEVQARLVSDKNPLGDIITNSDLELAGTMGQQDVLAQTRDCRERKICTLSDNTPAVSWQRKGSTTAAGAAACLLRLSIVCTRDTAATQRKRTTCRDHPMQWQMTARAFGTCPTHNCCTILIPNIHRRSLGACAHRDQRCIQR